MYKYENERAYANSCRAAEISGIGQRTKDKEGSHCQNCGVDARSLGPDFEAMPRYGELVPEEVYEKDVGQADETAARIRSAFVGFICEAAMTRQPIHLSASSYAGSYVMPRRRSVARWLFDLLRGR